MARLSRSGFLAVAVLFHVVYIYSIFDIYFVSPVVSGMRPFEVARQERVQPPARRLVLFVGDGLRADKAFQSFPDPSPASDDVDLTPRPLAPFLRSRVTSHGTFGISHTRVPTESRPGHVALIAGLYEDVSAVATGWKLNPVNFDSVFNRSSHTWSWGSPDILPMFKEGAVPGRVDAATYAEEAEDYTQDATQLDTWVFDRTKELFASARSNTTLDTALRQEKTVFFLHLLGLDMNGHAFRPYSKEYLHNLKVVDAGVQEMAKLIEDFYGDGKTAFVFTADHGMSDWGSHGDGHPDNTRTPLIAWGSGVARPKLWKSGRAPGHEDGVSADWGLDSVQRHDVAQADVAALMAYLAGLAFPVNSVGQLPLSYLAAGPQEKAEAALANAQSILEMYRVKESHKRATAFRFKPYKAFAHDKDLPETRIAQLQSMIKDGQFEEAITQALDLLHNAIEGLRYLQTYNWLFLRTLVTVGYLGWIGYATVGLLDQHVLRGQSPPQRTKLSSLISVTFLALFYIVLYLQQAPGTYFAYGVFPVYFWEEVFARRSVFQAGVKQLFGDISGLHGYVFLTGQTIAFIAILEALVQSYFHRTIYTICYILAATWPAFYGVRFLKENKLLVVAWVVGCFTLSAFTILPVVKVESIRTVSVGGGLMAATGILYLVFGQTLAPPRRKISVPKGAEKNQSERNSLSPIILGFQIGLILLAVAVTRSSIISLQAKLGLPLGSQIIGWLTLISSLAMPFAHKLAPNTHYLHRLSVIFLAFSPSFVILTISYEGLFYFAFCLTLVTWAQLEYRVHEWQQRHESAGSAQTNSTGAAQATSSKASETVQTKHEQATSSQNKLPVMPASHRSLNRTDLRTSLFFFYLLQSAFFSTGNIASVSSFSLDAVYRLIPIFDPFSQGALLTFKILAPFAVISANLGILNLRLGLERSALFMVVMAMADVMTLHFFWMVRDEGSWLDIGTSISHFVIGSLLNIFVAGLEGISGWFIAGVEIDHNAADSAQARAGVGAGAGSVKESTDSKQTKTSDTKPEDGNNIDTDKRLLSKDKD